MSTLETVAVNPMPPVLGEIVKSVPATRSVIVVPVVV